MKIVILDKENTADEDEIVIKCDTLDENIMQLLNSLKNGKDTLSLYSGTAIVLVDTKEVLYFESVDDRVFAYTAEQVYEAKQKLYQLEESLPDDFLRANKAVIVNVRKLETLRPDFGGRIEGTLCNGCAVIFSRMYVPLLKKKLGL